MALAAIYRDKPPWLCLNWKKEGHLTTYCIKMGGGMAGKTIEKAHTTQHNARRSRNNRGSNSQQMPSVSTNVVATTGVPPNGMVTING